MKAVSKIAIGAVGVAALVGAAAPAAAQYGYPGYNNPGNVIGQVLNQVLNPYGQYGNQYGGQYGYGYGASQQGAVQQCSAAVQQRLSGQYQAGYGGYGSPYGGGYNNAYSSARVLGITRVEQRSRGTLRVRGVATSGMGYGGYGNPYGGGYGAPYAGGYGSPYGGGYGNAGAPADLTFRCDIDYRGFVRDIDIDRRY